MHHTIDSNILDRNIRTHTLVKFVVVVVTSFFFVFATQKHWISIHTQVSTHSLGALFFNCCMHIILKLTLDILSSSRRVYMELYGNAGREYSRGITRSKKKKHLNLSRAFVENLCSNCLLARLSHTQNIRIHTYLQKKILNLYPCVYKHPLYSPLKRLCKCFVVFYLYEIIFFLNSDHT